VLAAASHRACALDDATMSSHLTTENTALRKTAKIALIREFGGDSAPLRLVAREAIHRGLYSANTTLGDIEGALSRVWRQWKRGRSR
jgi:hypothetical protein